MSTEFVSRIIGMLVVAIGGLVFGVRFAALVGSSTYLYGTTFMLLGALAGLILTPYFTVRPLRFIRQRIYRMPIQQLLFATLGLILGLIIASLSTFPLSMLPSPLNRILPFLSAVVFGYIGVLVMTARQQEIFALFSRGRLLERPPEWGDLPPVLLDTSVIIDGRIADISRTGFIRSEMLVPRFILNELQYIADSPDPIRRNRGRRGLDILRRLQEESISPVRVVDLDAPEARSVDDKLVLLAKRLRCPILTNDYNLNRVAELQGVHVLNVNELANAVRVVYLPGESLRIYVLQEGKEPEQGVGYLDDGTMVVVENGRPFIGTEVDVVVTKVLQTAAGRMIFARPAEHGEK